MLRFGLLAVWTLFWFGQVLGCDWNRTVEENQTLDADSMKAAMLRTDWLLKVGPGQCKNECCADPDCDMVLVGNLPDGKPLCMLVSCTDRDQARDLCVLQPSKQIKVYRKNQMSGAGGRAPETGHRPRIVPLLGPWSPETARTPRTRSVCVQPVRVGPCRASFLRFFYNASSRSCSSFIYGGCGANGNNFETQQECEETCRGGSDSPAATESVLAQKTERSAAEFAERCGAEPQVGPCRAAFQHWFYNGSTGSCQTFIYGGCKGNRNNYASRDECSAACTVSGVLPKKVVADDVSAEYREACLVTSDPGPCRAAFSMFYYDPDTATCQPFIYGGCRGNQNRYSSMEECLGRCSADGSSETLGKAANRWTAGVFLFVTLAAVSALLLATLIIVTLRRHRLSRRPSSVSDKEELLPDEQSSLESLALPESPKPDHEGPPGV